ncbi:MAG: UDP-N-acetylmuramate dehydrogenase [Trueperaceae bacterium]|nr:UDP-N-acetylmuramate dehydrogenase [Trueperaceae bacterium]
MTVDRDAARANGPRASGARVRVRPMAELTTLRVGGPAEVWEVDDVTGARDATSEPFRALGAGSNLLVADAGVEGRVVKLGRGFDDVRAFGDATDVWLGAATPLPGLVRRAQKAGLSGLEGVLGIPAVLGGAIAMNAGTRFGEMSDTVREVEVLVDGSVERLPADALDLRYRHATLPRSGLLLRARLVLTPSTPERVATAMEAVDAARKGQPKNKSAGCAFKNPVGDSAGRLIDAAGLKGLRVGDAMISHEHGNFVVNLGAATAADVLALLGEVRSRVGVPLELEWRRWGW